MKKQEDSIKSNFIIKLEESANIFTNLSTILDKVFKDGYLDILYETFENLFL